VIDDFTQYNRERLKLLKVARLKMLESQLQFQKKKGYDNKKIHQTMKDISHVKSEIQNLQK